MAPARGFRRIRREWEHKPFVHGPMRFRLLRRMQAELMDASQERVVSEAAVREMTQLGVMVLDEATQTHPVLFHEKPSADEVVAICKRHRASRL